MQNDEFLGFICCFTLSTKLLAKRQQMDEQGIYQLSVESSFLQLRTLLVHFFKPFSKHIFFHATIFVSEIMTGQNPHSGKKRLFGRTFQLQTQPVISWGVSSSQSGQRSLAQSFTCTRVTLKRQGSIWEGLVKKTEFINVKNALQRVS